MRVERGFVELDDKMGLKRAPDLFLSHSHQDKRFARQLARLLTMVGVDVFLDLWELAVGDSLHGNLQVALNSSRYVGILISPRFAKSRWCLDELSEALAREKRSRAKSIIPILCKRAPSLPFLSDRAFADCNTNMYRGVVQIAQVIHGLDLSAMNDALYDRPPQDIADVADILKDCGWNDRILVGAHEFGQFLRHLKEAELRYEKNGNLIRVPQSSVEALPDASQVKQMLSKLHRY